MIENSTDIEWFKSKIVPELTGRELSYRFFNEGDLGSLSQVEFKSKTLGGNIDFWGLGWLGILVWDYKKEEILLNILIEPHQEEEKIAALKKLQHLIK